MAVVDVDSLIFEQFTLTQSDFNDGRDEDTSLSAGQVGEIGEAEIGEDGQLSNYDAVQIGQPPVNNGDSTGNEPFVALDSAADTDVADTAEWACAVRRKGELSAGQAGMITGYVSHRRTNNTDPRQRTKLGPQSPVGKDGRVLQFLARDETSSVTVNLGESTIEIPALGGQ